MEQTYRRPARSAARAARRSSRRDEGILGHRAGGFTKELIALAVSVAIRCDDCIAFHAKGAVERGATREEVFETLGMAIYMGAGPAAMYASHAIEAFDQFTSQESVEAVG